MKLKRLTAYLFQHPLQTWVLVFAGTFIPIFGVLGILVAALITLRKNVVEGALLTIATIIPYFISFYVSGDKAAVSDMTWVALSIAILSNVLTWVFAVMLRRRTSWSLMLQIAALLGVLVVSVIHLIYPEIADWWAQELIKFSAATGLKEQAAAASDAQVEIINVTKQYVTGILVAATLFNALLQLAVARWWDAAVFTDAGNLSKELHAISLSPLAGMLFIMALGFSYLGNSVVLDIMPILYLLFSIAGLSLIHYLFGLLDRGSSWIWLGALYLALIISVLVMRSPTLIVLIAVLALVDVWFDMRKRVKKG